MEDGPTVEALTIRKKADTKTVSYTVGEQHTNTYSTSV